MAVEEARPFSPHADSATSTVSDADYDAVNELATLRRRLRAEQAENRRLRRQLKEYEGATSPPRGMAAWTFEDEDGTIWRNVVVFFMQAGIVLGAMMLFAMASPFTSIGTTGGEAEASPAATSSGCASCSNSSAVRGTPTTMGACAVKSQIIPGIRGSWLNNGRGIRDLLYPTTMDST
ncbi:unnamed protein product, partial [Mesorhabditis spiculigera]